MSAFPSDFPDQFAWLAGRVAELERRARNRKRTGEITEVDHKKGVARVKLSSPDGKDFTTAEIPWQEIAAGDIKTHISPSVGEQVDVVSENGDLTDAIIVMSTPSNKNPRPHDGPEAVITKGNTRITIADDVATIKATKIVLDCGGSVVTIDGDGVTEKGGKRKATFDDYEFN